MCKYSKILIWFNPPKVTIGMVGKCFWKKVKGRKFKHAHSFNHPYPTGTNPSQILIDVLQKRNETQQG